MPGGKRSVSGRSMASARAGKKEKPHTGLPPFHALLNQDGPSEGNAMQRAAKAEALPPSNVGCRNRRCDWLAAPRHKALAEQGSRFFRRPMAQAALLRSEACHIQTRQGGSPGNEHGLHQEAQPFGDVGRIED